MSATLAAVPLRTRRRAAGTLGAFAVLLLAIGVVATTGPAGGLLTAAAVVAFVVGGLLALLCWGVATSVRNERLDRTTEAAVDRAIAEAIAGADGSAAVREFSAYGCGHDHDPDELHVSDDPCAHDGGGIECSHTCDTCVLSRHKIS